MRILLGLVLLAASFLAHPFDRGVAQAQQIVLPCVPSGNSCIPVSAANPLPTTGGGGSFPPSGCSTANGVIFNNAAPCDSGFTYAGSGGQLALSGAALAGTTALLINPASSTGSLIDAQVGSASRFAVRASDGQLKLNNADYLFITSGSSFGMYNASQTAAGAGTPSQALVLVSASVYAYAFGGNRGGVFGRLFSGGSLELGTGGEICIGSNTEAAGNCDTFQTRGGAATWQLGAANAAAPVAQTLGVQNVVAGTMDTGGANWTINGSKSTGAGVGGSILMQVSKTGTTGTTVNTNYPLLTLIPGSATTATVQFGDGTNFTTYDSCTALTTSATGVIACTASAIRFKELYDPQLLNLAGLDALRTDVPWRYREDAGHGLDPSRIHVGLFADEVAAMDPRCGVWRDGETEPSDYEDRCVIAYLVGAVKSLRMELHVK